jgi:kynurenine formamidase
MQKTSSSRWNQRPSGSNWGDFGPDDQIGRMNLLTPERRLHSFREVRNGEVFCLSLPLDLPGGNAIFPFRKPPRLHAEPRGSAVNYNYPFDEISPEFTDVISDDAVLLYTQYSTQWDALGHAGQYFDVNSNGQPVKVYYNGYQAERDILSPSKTGGPWARALSIDNLATTCVQGRGVLVNLKAIYGEQHHLVGYDDLMRAMEADRVDLSTGDILCLYTGTADMIVEMAGQPDPQRLRNSCAVLDGRDQKLLDWIDDSGLVAICSDNLAVEAHPARPGQGAHYASLPLHEHCLFKLGIHLAELWYFRDLANWLGRNNRNSFLLTAPPLRLRGAVGSPVTPVATV